MGKKEYDKLLPILKRYSFEDKMLEAMRLSRMTMGANGIIESVVLRRLALPWEIETFVLFSVMAKEWKDGRFQKDDKGMEGWKISER